MLQHQACSARALQLPVPKVVLQQQQPCATAVPMLAACSLPRVPCHGQPFPKAELQHPELCHCLVPEGRVTPPAMHHMTVCRLVSSCTVAADHETALQGPDTLRQAPLGELQVLGTLSHALQARLEPAQDVFTAGMTSAAAATAAAELGVPAQLLYAFPSARRLARFLAAGRPLSSQLPPEAEGPSGQSRCVKAL